MNSSAAINAPVSLSDQITLTQLKQIFKGDVQREISFGLLFPENAHTYLPLVNKAIDYISSEFSKTPKERKDRSEDGLTIDIVFSLNNLGFTASHDKTIGGHCDIVIEGRFNFLWLAEAKKHSTYAWLLKGFNQLDTRYATASANQDYGSLIIYCHSARADEVMKRWKEYLIQNRNDVSAEIDPSDGLIMNSKHIHRRTGRTYYVRHKIISLFFSPQDG